MGKSTKPARKVDDAFETDLIESDSLEFYRLRKNRSPKFIPTDEDDHEPEIILVVDIGSNSVKAEIFKIEKDGLESLYKFGLQCGLGQDIDPEDLDNASLNQGAIHKIRNEVLPILRKLINGEPVGEDDEVFEIDTATAFCTEWLRVCLRAAILNQDQASIDQIEGLIDEIAAAAVRPVIASEELELHLSHKAVTLDGSSEEQQAKGFKNGIMYFGGGASIQVAELRNGEIVDGHQAVLHLGARTLYGKKNINRLIDNAIDDRAEWLDPATVKNKNACFAGGMFRVVGRTLAQRLHDISPVGEGMPLEGYTFTFKTKEQLQDIRTALMELQKATSQELFERTFATDRASLESVLDGAKNEGKEIRVYGVKIEPGAIEKKLDKYKDRIEDRVDYLATDIQFVLNHLDRMYGDGKDLPFREHSITFSGGNTRMACAASVPNCP